MAAERQKAFLVYHDLEDQTAEFSNAEVGELFRAMMAYARRGEETTDFSSDVVKGAYLFVKVQLRENAAKYEERCKQNKENALKKKRQTKQDEECTGNPFAAFASEP